MLKAEFFFAWLPGAAEPEGRNNGKILSVGAFGVQETSLRLFSIHKHSLFVQVSELRVCEQQREGKTNARAHAYVQTYAEKRLQSG